MPKLCQVIAVASGIKTAAQKVVADALKDRLKPPLLAGLSRSYKPLNDEGEKLPSEDQRVQLTVPEVVKEVRSAFVEAMDVVLTQETGNTTAKADIKVGDVVVLKDAPVTYLLFLEKQMVELESFIEKLPVLDGAEVWEDDPDIGGYKTKPHETLKTAKVYRTHVAHEPTPEHPAQVQTYTVDETVGRWTTTKKSGAIRPGERNVCLARARALRNAIKVAREEANSLEVTNKQAGTAVLDFVFGSLGKK